MLSQLLVKSWIKKNYKNEEFKDQFTNQFWFVWDCFRALNPWVQHPLELLSEDKTVVVSDGLVSWINQTGNATKIKFDKTEIDFTKFADQEPEWLKILRLGQTYFNLIEDLRYQTIRFDSPYNWFSTGFFNRFETSIRINWGIQFNLSVLLQEYLFTQVIDESIYDFFADSNQLQKINIPKQLGEQFGIAPKVYRDFAQEILAIAKIFYWQSATGHKLCDLQLYPEIEIQRRKSNFDPNLYNRRVLALWDEKTVQFLFNEHELDVHDLTTKQYINNERDSEPVKCENLLVAEQGHKNYLVLVNHREKGIENLSRSAFSEENAYIVNYQLSKYLSNKFFFPEANLSGICLVTNFNNNKIRTYFVDDSELQKAIPVTNWVWRTEIYQLFLEVLLNQPATSPVSVIKERLQQRASCLERWLNVSEEQETPFQPQPNLVLWAEFYTGNLITAPSDAQFQYKFLSNLNPTPSQLNGVMNFLKWNKTYGNCLKSDVELFDHNQTIRAYKAYIRMQKLEQSIQGDSRLRLELGHLLEPEILQFYRNKYQNSVFQNRVQSDKRTYAWFNEGKWYFLDIDGYIGDSLNHPEQIVEIKSSGSPKYIGDIATYVKSYYLQICMYHTIFQPTNGIKMLLMLTSNRTSYEQKLLNANKEYKVLKEYQIHEVNVQIKPEWQANFRTALRYWELAKQELLKEPDFLDQYRQKLQSVLQDLNTTQDVLIQNFNNYLADNKIALKYRPDIFLNKEVLLPTPEMKEIKNPSNLDDEQYRSLKEIYEEGE